MASTAAGRREYYIEVVSPLARAHVEMSVENLRLNAVFVMLSTVGNGDRKCDLVYLKTDSELLAGTGPTIRS